MWKLQSIVVYKNNTSEMCCHNLLWGLQQEIKSKRIFPVNLSAYQNSAPFKTNSTIKLSAPMKPQKLPSWWVKNKLVIEERKMQIRLSKDADSELTFIQCQRQRHPLHIPKFLLKFYERIKLFPLRDPHFFSF